MSMRIPFSCNVDPPVTLIGHEGPVAVVIELSDGRIVSGGYDKTIRVWSCDKEQSTCDVMLSSDNIASLCELAEQSLLAVGLISKCNAIELWDLATSNRVWTFETHCHVNAASRLISLTMYPIYFASSSVDGTIKVWDVQSKKCVSTLNKEQAHGGKSITAMIPTIDGRRIITGGEDSSIKIWTLDCIPGQGQQQEACIFLTGEVTLFGHRNFIRNITLLNDGRICSISIDNKVMLWDNSNVGSLVIDGSYSCSWNKSIVQLGDGSLAINNLDHTISIWRCFSGRSKFEKIEMILHGHKQDINRLISLRDNRLCSCSNDATIKIWSLGI